LGSAKQTRLACRRTARCNKALDDIDYWLVTTRDHGGDGVDEASLYDADRSLGQLPKPWSLNEFSK
jgi:hypothetical protein